MPDYWRELPPEIELFDYANDFVAATLLPDVPVVKENRQIVWASLEKPFFRPAVELLVAGLICGRTPLAGCGKTL